MSIKVTLPIKGRQYRMHNFVLFDENDEWDDTVVVLVNEELARKRETFLKSLNDGTFWDASMEFKHILSPEIHRIGWIDLDTAIDFMSSSMEDTGGYVDDWQRLEFNKYGISHRDPMYQSMMVLEEIRHLGTIDAIKQQAIAFEESILL